MRFLYTITSYPPAVGGAQLHTHQLVQQVRAAGHEAHVATHWRTQRYDWLLGTTLRAPWRPTPYCIDGVPVEMLRWPAAERLRLLPALLAFYPCQHWAVDQIARPLARHLDALAPPETALIHNVRIGREGLSWASFHLARQRGIPFVFTPLHHDRWESWFHRAYLRLYRQADLVIALTEAERQTLGRLGVADTRIVVTGIGPILAAEPGDPAAFRAQHGLGEAPVILFLAQKYRYKGLAALLDAAPIVWARCPEARFVFVGPRTPYSAKLFAAHRDPRLVEIDRVSAVEKNAALAAATVLCVPSSQESFGGVFVEAWTFGKPVVGGDIPTVREVISVGEDGFVARQNGEEIADRLLALLENPSLAATMGAAGRRKAATRYSWSHLAERTLAGYERALATHRAIL